MKKGFNFVSICFISLLSLTALMTSCSLFPQRPDVDYNDDDEGYEGEDQLITVPLDKKIDDEGIVTKEDKYFSVSEDSYVLNGVDSPNDSINKNFGREETIEVKGVTSSKTLGRIAYLKFDLTGIETTGIYKANLLLNCKSTQTSKPTSIALYEVNPTSWNESTITFNNRPNEGILVAETSDSSSGLVSLDITTFIKQKVRSGARVVSFAIINTSNPTCRIIFNSKESGDSIPKIQVRYSEVSFTTVLKVGPSDADPWEYAVRMVNSWYKDKADILDRPLPRDSWIPDIYPSEYTLNVDAARAEKTDGDNTQYTTYKTRTLDTMTSYSYNHDEKYNYDKYGGLIGTKSFDATGFFYVTEEDGRYWTVDPLGNPYYRVAMNALSSGDEMCQEAIIRQYGSLQNWAENETRFLKDTLGYNSAGAWSSDQLLLTANDPFSQSPIIYFAANYGKEIGVNNTTGGSTTFINHAMPVFNPGFETFSDKRAKEVVVPYKDNPNIYGWILDNELEAGDNMLLNFMTLSTEEEVNSYSYATVWTYLYAKLNKYDISTSDITDAMKKEFRAMVYDRYFNVTCNAVRKYDTNHMLMGSRYLRTIFNDEWCMKVAGYYNDIVTFNMYNIWTPSDGSNNDSFINIHNWTGRPFAVTEWYAKGMDACTEESRLTNKSGAGWTVRTQTDRGYFYHNYALRLMECKYCVGFDYFKLWDNNPYLDGADTSNTNSNKGIYNIKHEPYAALTNAMAELNLNKYSLISFFDLRN